MLKLLIRGYTEEYETSFMQVGPGQRFSMLVHTKCHPEKRQYIIQAETRDFPPAPAPPTRSFAILNYVMDNETTVGSFYPPYVPPVVGVPPIKLPPTDSAFLDYKLSPKKREVSGYATNPADIFPTAAEVTRRVNITFQLEITKEGELIYKINGYPWYENTVQKPYLVALYENDGLEWPSIERAIMNDGLDPQTYAFPAKTGEVLEVVIQGKGSTGGGIESHPWHAHGAHYWDLGCGDGVYNQTENEAKWANSTGKPIKRE